MEMPAPESRRDSLEASFNDSIMDTISCNNEDLNATLDLSQVSGWSALTPGWNDSFKISLVDSESEEASDRVAQQNQEQERLAIKTSLHDLFIENCCTLYNDIQNAIDELEFVEQLQCFESLESRENRLMEQAKLLAESAPDLADIVQLRMQTLNRAMEQLRIKHGSDSARSNSSKSNYGPSHQFRKWLQSVESQLDKFRSEIHSEQGSTIGGLQRLAADHQVLQLRIEAEGQSLLSAAKKQFQIGSLKSDEKKQDRARKNLELLEQRLFSSWLRSLENLERIEFCLKHLQGPDLPDQSNFSEDEEPQLKRRRTVSNFSDNFFQSNQFPSSALSPCPTVDSDAQLIPSSTDSECGGLDPDTIPFSSSDYVSFEMPVDLETKNYPTVENWSTVEITNSCGKQLLDIGYSSGENSTESPIVSSGGTSPDSERKIKITTNSTKSFYKTVPLDEGGLTDNENPLKFAEKEIEVELPTFEPLSDSMIVQPDFIQMDKSENFNQIDNDYNEVISMLDDDSENLFNVKLEQLKKGTHWKELKSKNKRISTPRRSLPGLLNGDQDKSREASSEESDSGKNKVNMNPAALPPVPGRKRRFKKVVKNNKGGSMEILKNSLSNVAMDESIYVYTGSNDPMSQSLNSSFNDSNSRRTILSKRKFDKTRMHRSASDHVNINLSINNLSNSFHSQHSSTSVFASFLPNFGTPLMSSTLKRDGNLPRRPSVESVASSTSSGTVHETGDAHYEWDEYRDPPSFPDMSTMLLPDPSASTSSILDDTLIDEDFQNQLPIPDPAGIDFLLNESRKSITEIKRVIEDYGVLEEEKEDIRSGLRSSVKNNLQKLTAIVQASPRQISMDQINEVEELRKQWKDVLDDLGSDPMEDDQKIFKEIQSHLCEIKGALRKLMEIDVSTLTLEELENLIFERKSLWQKLIENKRALNILAESTGDKYRNEELLNLLKYIEESLGFVGEGTDILAESMIKYRSMGDLRMAMVELESKMDKMEKGKTDLVEQIESELDLCQERLNALETVCNTLTSQFGDIAALSGNTKPGRQTKFWREFKQFRSEFEKLKERFGMVKKSSNTTPKNSATVVVNGTFGSVPYKRTAVKESSTSTVSSKSDAEVQSEPQVGFFGRTLNAIRDSKFLKFLLGLTGFLLLCLIFVTFYFDDSPQNNWKRMFGPQLEYINGRPPS